MIEIEHQQVGFTAINAGVTEQILHDPAEVLSYVPSRVAMCVSDVRRSISLVMGPIPSLVTRATISVADPSCDAPEGELAEFLDFAAPAAAFLTLLGQRDNCRT
jgi:hypothetical protein